MPLGSREKDNASARISKRKAQLKEAQRTYQARKKEARVNLETNVSRLQCAVGDINKVVLRLSNELHASSVFASDQAMVQRLEEAVHEASTLAQDAIVDAAPRESPARHSHRSQSGTAITVVGPERSSDPPLPVAVRYPASPSPWKELSHHNHRILLQHPHAKSIFPHTVSWPTFAYNLHWASLYRAYLALVGNGEIPTALGYKLFRYTLIYMPRANLLKAMRFMLGYKAVAHSAADEIVTLERTNMFPSPAEPLDDNNTRRILHGFIRCCENLNADIQQTLQSDGQSWSGIVDAVGVEQYLRDQGATINGSDVFIRHKSIRAQAIPTDDDIHTSHNRHDRTCKQPRSSCSGPLFPVEQETWFEPQALLFKQATPTNLFATQASPTRQDSGSTATVKLDAHQLIEELTKFSFCTGTVWAYPVSSIDAIIDRMVVQVS